MSAAPDGVTAEARAAGALSVHAHSEQRGQSRAAGLKSALSRVLGPIGGKLYAVSSKGARYERVRAIASGGMATVYLGRAIDSDGLGRLVAIKVMHRHIAMNPEFVMMFLDEARLASRIQHPNVVSLLDVDVDDSGVFLVMDYIEGSSLHKVMKVVHGAGRRLPFSYSLKIMIDALRGLHAAHQLRASDGAPLNLVHRDVSPQNILVGVDGRARITDFGVAHAELRLAPSTQSGHVKGKYGYMSIEQLRTERVDARSDVYSSGVVLWELLTGERLFKGDNDGAVALAAGAGPVQSPRDVNEDVPEILDEVAMRALARFPEDRYQSAALFADALEEAAERMGISVAKPAELGRFMMRLDEDVPTELAPKTMKDLAEMLKMELGGSATHGSGSVESLSIVTDVDDEGDDASTVIRSPVEEDDSTSDDEPATRIKTNDDDDAGPSTVLIVDAPDRIGERGTLMLDPTATPRATGEGMTIEMTTQALASAKQDYEIPSLSIGPKTPTTSMGSLVSRTAPPPRPEPPIRRLNRIMLAGIAALGGVTLGAVLIALEPDPNASGVASPGAGSSVPANAASSKAPPPTATPSPSPAPPPPPPPAALPPPPPATSTAADEPPPPPPPVKPPVFTGGGKKPPKPPPPPAGAGFRPDDL